MAHAILAAMFVLTAAAFAQQSAPSDAPPVADPPSIQRYGDADTSCLRWADSCRACSRDADGAPACSNIGIACQPKKIECLERKADAERKDDTPK